MRGKRLSVVAAQHAAPGERAWYRSAHSARRCRFFVGAPYIVPGERAWRRTVHSRVTIRGTRNASHASPLTTPRLLHFTRHTVPSSPSRNFMKTKDRAPRKVSHFFSPAPSDFSAVQRSRR
jgi:hypothetical protein